MVTDTQKQKVFHIIDTREDEIIQTISDLARIRSVNPGYPGVNVLKKFIEITGS